MAKLCFGPVSLRSYFEDCLWKLYIYIYHWMLFVVFLMQLRVVIFLVNMIIALNLTLTEQIITDWNFEIWFHQIDGLVQDCSISIALAMEILQSCTKPSKYFVIQWMSWSKWGNNHIVLGIFLYAMNCIYIYIMYICVCCYSKISTYIMQIYLDVGAYFFPNWHIYINGLMQERHYFIEFPQCTWRDSLELHVELELTHGGRNRMILI